MALKDDILSLPSTVGEGSAGHLGNHATLHAAAKNHETRLTSVESGKADKTVLDSRVEPGMALRVDTTVGTRIFSGNTMIYGDTGWRNVTDLYLAESPDKSLEFGTSGGLFVRRTAEFLHVRLMGTLSTTAAGTTTNIFPAGWRASTASSRTPLVFAGSSSNGWPTSHLRTTSGNAFMLANMPVGDLLVWNESAHAIIPATTAWPSTLIGLPV